MHYHGRILVPSSSNQTSLGCLSTMVSFAPNTASDFGPRSVDVQELLDGVVVRLCQKNDVKKTAVVLCM